MSTRQTPGTRAKDSDRNDTCAILDSALGDGQLSNEEHRQRVASATTAATLGDLQGLVSDLQTANAPVQLPNLKPRVPAAAGGWGIRAAIAGVLVVLGIGIGWGLYGNTSSPLNFTSDPGAKSDGVGPVVLTPPRQLHSLGGLTGVFEQMKQKFGDTTGYRLVVYPDYASLDRPDPGEDRRSLNYSYRGGWDDPSSSSKSDTARVVDLAKFDMKAVIGVLHIVGEDGDEGILEALNSHRVRIQSAVGKQVRAKKTPILSFKPDEVIRSAEHIQRILDASGTLPQRPAEPAGDLDDDRDDRD